jgi:glucokinase
LDEKQVIGVDLGGTKILAGVVGREGRIERRRETPTPLESQEALLESLDAAVQELVDERVRGVGFGVPSRINGKTGLVEGSVNIPLEGLDLRRRMEERFDLPVAVDNDANVATYAEFRAGAGRNAETMVMLTLGTGCGGGVVLDGQLYRGWAELGHTVIEFDGLRCQGTCTGRGHLEAYVSGTAATALAQEAFGPAADAHRLVRLAREGDAQAVEILAGIGRRLGAGIGSFVNIFDPDLVVIGGGFAAAGDLLFEPAREVMRREALAPEDDRVRIVPAELGTAAGLIGAGLLAFDAAEAA